MSNKKAQQLGMPIGTASARLRKRIIFSLLKRLDETSCFKCGEEILKPDDLSIEHKLPWLDRDVSRFWDLDNVAFSHKGCNRPHRPNHFGNNPASAARALVSRRAKAKFSSPEEAAYIRRMSERGFSCRDIGWLLNMDHESVSRRIRVRSESDTRSVVSRE